jgi:hypothetical protein
LEFIAITDIARAFRSATMLAVVVVHLEEEHVVWTIGHHKDVELAAARLLDGIGGVLLDRLDILRHFGWDDDEIDCVDVDATRLRRGRHAQQRIEVGVARIATYTWRSELFVAIHIRERPIAFDTIYLK